MLDALTSLLEAGAAAPWVLRLVLLVAAGDALVPPIPSEGVVVALAAVAVAGDGPNLLLLALAAGVGAFLGDTPTFLVGRRSAPTGSPGPPGRAARRARAGVRHPGAPRRARHPRGALRSGRPGRGQPHRRCDGLPAGASSASPRWRPHLVGVVGRRGGARRALGADNPLLGAAAGMALALLGLAADHVARRVLGWGGVPAPAAPTVGGPGRRAVGPAADPAAVGTAAAR